MPYQPFEEILNFLKLLSSHKIQYKIEQQMDDAIMVSFSSVGMRIEVDFYSDHVEYCTFTGDETPSRDMNGLYNIIKDLVN